MSDVVDIRKQWKLNMDHSEENQYVLMHGDEWKLADIFEAVEWARQQKWKKQKWFARPALVSNGKISEFVGQKFNPEYSKLVEDGWGHDHCEICFWTLFETDSQVDGVGFTCDGHKWLCVECFTQFVDKSRDVNP